ncbi:MAG: hypothetical protein ACYS0E_00770 [Planctomycetota bacterium]|jgi:type II secretory pathway component PulJ
MRERGFSVLELVVATAVFLSLLGGIGAALARDARTARVLVGHMGPELGARRVLDRLTADLQLASVESEDLNQNGVLDPGEDTNENDVLDADWSLEDGAVDQPIVRFNLRTDEYDSAGYRTAAGVYSGRVTYRVVDSKLMREWTRPLPTGGTETMRIALAERVTGLRFTREDKVVTVEVDVRIPEGISDVGTRTISTSVRLLN